MTPLALVSVLLCLTAVAVLPALTNLLGGVSEISVENAEMKMLLDKAVAKINAESDSLTWQKVDQILAAERQVINGIFYSVQVTLRQTACPKAESVENCAAYGDTSNGETSTCRLEFVNRPWEPEMEVDKYCD